MAQKPNILLVCTDTQRCDTLRCMGNPHAISPNVDRLAREGVLFEEGYTPAPVCMPARACLLTGLHTPVHGAIENGVSRLTHFPTFPDLLKEQGYTDMMIGKSHFGPVPDTFDVVLGGEHDAYLAKLGYGPTKSYTHPTPIPEEHFRETYLADRTIEEMDRVVKAGDGPFFAFYSMTAPHPPETPPGEWGTLYDGVPLPELNYVEGEELNQPAHTRRLLGIEAENRLMPGEDKTHVGYWREAIGRIIETEHLETIDRVRRLYYGFASYCDAQFGRVLAYLDENGLRENTLVIFTSDHGQQYFDHGFNDKHNYYDATWRIPLVMSMPGTLPQGEVRDFAIWNDITATMLSAAGTSCQTMQGLDLFAPLAAGEPSPRRCAVAALYKSCALATKRWKLEYYLEEGTGRLFDRENDPLERTDLYDSPDHREIRNELLIALLSWRSDISDLKTTIDSTSLSSDSSPDGYLKVAPRIARHTVEMRGADSEERLNERVGRIDENVKR